MNFRYIKKTNDSWSRIVEFTVCIYLLYVLFPAVPFLIPQFARYLLSILMIVIGIIAFLSSNKERIVNNTCKIIVIFVFVILLYIGKWKSYGSSFISFFATSVLYWNAYFLGETIISNKEINSTKIYHLYISIIIITLFTTIWGNIQFPYASRLLASGTNSSIAVTYQRMNIGGYRFVYGLTLLVPYLMFKIKMNSHKFLYLVLLTLCVFCMLITQYLIAFLTTFFSLGISIFYEQKRPQKTLKKLITLLLVLYLISMLLMPLLDNIQKYFTDKGLESLSDRIGMIVEAITKGNISGDAADRSERYLRSISVFLENPVTGSLLSPKLLGGHSEMLDILAAGGVLLFSQYIIIMSWHIKNIRFNLEHTIIPYTFISFVIYVIISSINTAFSSNDIAVVLFIVPYLIRTEHVFSTNQSSINNRCKYYRR